MIQVQLGPNMHETTYDEAVPKD